MESVFENLLQRIIFLRTCAEENVELVSEENVF
jgi:hypothetical protein